MSRAWIQYRIFEKNTSVHNVVANIRRLSVFDILWKQKKGFEKFREEHLPLSACKFTRASSPQEFSKYYGAVICGSDQIWNVTAKDCDPIFFLPGKQSYKKIAYAASVNTATYNEDVCDDQLRKNILDFDYISIREHSGAKKISHLGTATYSTVMAKSALMTEEEITLALFLYPVGNALFTLISGFVSDKFGRKVTIVAMSCSALTCYLLFIFSGMFKWTPYLTGFAIGGFMGSYWGAGDTIGGIMFSESTPTNLRSSVTVINTLLNGVMGGLATVITMILLPIIPERMFGYMYLGLTVPGLVGAIVIMWLFVGETRGLDLKTVTGTEWDKPKKVKEEQQDGE